MNPKPCTMIVLRHAEKGIGADPDLTEQGRQRARDLSQLLKGAPIHRMYCTEYIRTRQTLEPLSEISGTGIETISAEDAKALSRCESVGLSLEGLDHLSGEAAEELSRCRADWLTIGGGYEKTSSGTLSLGSLDSISETTASALSRFQGQTLMLFVKHISEEVAVALSHYPGLLNLTTLETLPDAAAHALAGRKARKDK